MNKKLFAGSLAAVALAGGGLATAGHAFAADSTGSSTDIVTRLAEKFNLNKSDVQAVFDADRADHQAQAEADAKAKLDAAVKDGNLTQAQEDLIIAKRAEIQQEREANKPADGTQPSEADRAAMKAKMDSERAALETWAKDNGIDMKWLMLGGPGGHGGPGGMPPKDDATGSGS